MAYAPGESVFAMGSFADRVYLVLEGKVRLSRLAPDGRELALAVIGPGGILGEIALLDGGERTAEATALVQTRLAALTRGQFMQAIAAQPEQALRLILALCRRLRQADEMIEDLTFYGVKERLQNLLARLEEQHQGEFLAAMTHQELAEMIGASRESVTRALGEIRRERERR
ncbi:MAG: Crp/Fnr family transcriptional regulator [Patescibacteria group bacterium]